MTSTGVTIHETLFSGLGRLIKAEFYKLQKRTMTKVLIIVMVGIIVLVDFLLLAISNVNLPPGMGGGGRIENLLGLPSAIPFSLTLISSFGAVLTIILMASSTGNEYNWKTIRIAMTASESRFKFLAAKLISVSLFVLAGMLISVAAGFIASMLTTAIGGYAFNFDFATGSYLWAQFLQFLRTFFVIMPYAALGFLMAIVGRSAMPGIATGIGVVFLESIITTFMVLAGGWIATVPNYLLSANVNSIVSLSDLPTGFGRGIGGGIEENLPSPSHAYITLAIYTVAFLVMAFYFFRKRDITS